MKKIYPEQLYDILNKKLYNCYLIYGNEALLFQESKDLICKIAKKNDFKEKFNFNIDNKTNWNVIFNICSTVSLFSKAQIVILNFSDSKLNTELSKNLLKLSTIVHQNIILLLCVKKFSQVQEKETWFKNFSQNLILVPCFTPEECNLKRWITARAKKLKINLTSEVNNLLCYYYEGNLLSLSQILSNLCLLYPKKKINISDTEKVISDFSNFTPFHWINSLLLGKTKRVLRILNQLENFKDVPIHLMIHILQRELILLLNLKRINSYENIQKKFKKLNIWKTRQILLEKALQRIENYKLYQVIQCLAYIERFLENEVSLAWMHIKTLSLILCDVPIPDIFLIQ